MRIAICDDVGQVRQLLAARCGRLCPEAQVSLYGSGEELLSAGEAPDILFLDIQLPGRNGMEIAAELRKRYPAMILIFVTGLEEYVYQAFDVGAFHYLVKPISDERFFTVLNRALEQWRGGGMAAADGQALNSSRQQERSLLVKTKGSSVRVPLQDIVYAEVFNRKIVLHTLRDTVEYYGRLSELERQAGEDFFRSHRAYLVHLKYVERYDASTIYLEKGSVLMAKNKYPQFVKSYLNYMRREGMVQRDGK